MFFLPAHEKFPSQHVIAVSFSRIPKCFTTRSAFCPTASGNSRMHWRKHMLFTTAKDTLFCQTSCCNLNVPWSGNLGTKFHLLRKPRPRKLSTLWGLCQSERTYRSFSLSLSLPGRSPTPVARTFMARPRIHTYVLPRKLDPVLSFKVFFLEVSPTGQAPSSSDYCAGLTHCF